MSLPTVKLFKSIVHSILLLLLHPQFIISKLSSFVYYVLAQCYNSSMPTSDRFSCTLYFCSICVKLALLSSSSSSSLSWPEQQQVIWCEGITVLWIIGHLGDWSSLMIDSTSASRVSSPPSFRGCSFRRAFITILVVRIQRSQTPLWWDAPGGLKIHMMLLLSRKLWIFVWLHLLTASRSCLSPLTNFPTLSDLICRGWPLGAINCLRTFIKESVCKL